MNRYSVTQRRLGSYSDRNGRTVRFDDWHEVLTIDASGTNSALRQADQKWPGHEHRANLIQSPLTMARRELPACDRNDIHALTTQTA